MTYIETDPTRCPNCYRKIIGVFVHEGDTKSGFRCQWCGHVIPIVAQR